MMRRALVAGLLCLTLAGCLVQGDRHQVNGEKLGPGHCRQAGIIEIAIQSFQGPPNATLTLDVRNLKDETLNGIENFLRVKGAGTGNYQGFYGKWSTHGGGWLRAHENATLVFQLTDVPEAPWKEINLDYNQGGKDPVVTPSTLHCSLTGDNAPWAFATNATQPQA